MSGSWFPVYCSRHTQSTPATFGSTAARKPEVVARGEPPTLEQLRFDNIEAFFVRVNDVGRVF
jgi:hypothetical protein